MVMVTAALPTHSINVAVDEVDGEAAPLVAMVQAVAKPVVVLLVLHVRPAPVVDAAEVQRQRSVPVPAPRQ